MNGYFATNWSEEASNVNNVTSIDEASVFWRARQELQIVANTPPPPMLPHLYTVRTFPGEKNPIFLVKRRKNAGDFHGHSP